MWHAALCEVVGAHAGLLEEDLAGDIAGDRGDEGVFEGGGGCQLLGVQGALVDARLWC